MGRPWAARRRALVWAIGIGAALIGWPAADVLAQAKFPDRPVKIIVPFSPGGASDLLGRLIAQGLQEVWGQSVVVENRPGAGSNLGANAVAKAEPDGHTLLLASSAIIAAPALYKSLPYDITKDLTPIAEVVGGPNIFFSGPNSTIASVADMIAQAKADPSKLNYGSPGTGTTPHLAMEFLKLRAQVNVTHIAYGGGGPAMQAVLANTVQLGSLALSNIHAQIKAGAYKGVAVTGSERWHDLPDVPTVAEAGFPGFDFETIFILMAPGATPQPIIDTVTKEVIAILQKPDVKARMQAIGMATLAKGPDALRARIAREVPMYKDVVTQAKIPTN